MATTQGATAELIARADAGTVTYSRHDGWNVTRDELASLFVLFETDYAGTPFPVRLVRRPAGTTVRTDEYRRSHLRLPKGYGFWMFESATGDRHSVTDTYTAACKSLPAGSWKVLP